MKVAVIVFGCILAFACFGCGSSGDGGGEVTYDENKPCESISRLYCKKELDCELSKQECQIAGEAMFIAACQNQLAIQANTQENLALCFAAWKADTCDVFPSSPADGSCNETFK